MKKLERCNSQTLFEMKNRQSLQRMRKTAKPQLSTAAPLKVSLHNHIKTNVKQQKRINSQLDAFRMRQKTQQSSKSLKSRVKIRSLVSKKSLDAKDRSNFDLRHHEDQVVVDKKELEPRARIRQNKRLSINLKIQKVPLKIEKGEFRSIIPPEGFVQAKTIYDNPAKQEDIIVSTQGVIIKGKHQWQFQGLNAYQAHLRKIERIVGLDFFRYFYKYRIFWKWRKLSRFGKLQSIKTQLQKKPRFDSITIAFALKSSQLFSSFFKSHLAIPLNILSPISSSSYQAHLYSSLKPQLASYKLNIFQEFVLHLLFSLRQISKDYNKITNDTYSLPSDIYEDYYLRSKIQYHQTLLYRFLLEYQEKKVDVIRLLLWQIKQKIFFNLHQFNQSYESSSHFIKQIEKSYKTDGNQSCQIQKNAFKHQIILEPMLVTVTQTKDSIVSIRTIAEKILPNVISKAKEFLKEKYASIKQSENQLEKIIIALCDKKIISRRQSQILKDTLIKIKEYCLIQHWKQAKEQFREQIYQLNQSIVDNLDIVEKAVEAIKDSILKDISTALDSKLSFGIQSWLQIQRLINTIQIVPTHLNIGMFCLNIQNQLANSLSKLKSRSQKIISACIPTYHNKISELKNSIEQYNAKISISSWTISEFLVSHEACADFMGFYSSSLTPRLAQLQSILLTINRVQFKHYEGCYIQLFHLKQMAESSKNKAYTFMKEITHKLKYLANEKQQQYQAVNIEIQKMQRQISSINQAETFTFQEAYENIFGMQRQLTTIRKQVNQIYSFVQLEKTYSMKDDHPVSFVHFEQFRSSLSCLITLMEKYREFFTVFTNQLHQQYTAFPTQYLLSRIATELAQIKQTIRHYSQFQTILQNIYKLYENCRLRIDVIKIAQQLTSQDLIQITPYQYDKITKNSGREMESYVRDNHQIVTEYLQKKQLMTKLKQKNDQTFESINSFMLTQGQLDSTAYLKDISNLINILECESKEIDSYIDKQFCKDIKNQLKQCQVMRKHALTFLQQYKNLLLMYKEFCSYFRYQDEDKQDRFSSLFKDDRRLIAEKWEQLLAYLRQSNLKDIAQNNCEFQAQKFSIVKNLLTSQLNKLKLYLNRRIEEFPLLNLLGQEQIIDVLNQPILFLRYYYLTVKEVSMVGVGGVTMMTIYGQKIIIDKQKVATTHLIDQSTRQCRVDLAAVMANMGSLIKNSLSHLISLPLEESIEIANTQYFPIQVIFVADHYNTSTELASLQAKEEKHKIVDQQIRNLVLLLKSTREKIYYHRYLQESILVSKLQLKNKLRCQSQQLSFVYRKQNQDLTLSLYHQALALDYQLVDPTYLTIIEPINHRQAIKTYQALIQTKSLIIFQRGGIQNVCARLMRIVYTVSHPRTDQFQRLVNVRQNVSFYFPSRINDTEVMFYAGLKKAYEAISNYMAHHERTIRDKRSSSKLIQPRKPIFFFQIPSSLKKQIKGTQPFQPSPFFNELSIEIKLTFRVVEFFEPSVSLLIKLQLHRYQLQLDDKVEKQILASYVNHRNNKESQGRVESSRDVMVVLREVIACVANHPKIGPQQVSPIFTSVISGSDPQLLFKTETKKRAATFNEQISQRKDNQRLSLSREPVCLQNDEFLRFSKQMDDHLAADDIILIVGPPASGKSYLLHKYVENLNSSQHQSMIRSKPAILQRIDTSFFLYQTLGIGQQLQAILRHNQVTEGMILLWIQSGQHLNHVILQMIKNDLCRANLQRGEVIKKGILQVSSLRHFTPADVESMKKIYIRNKAYNFNDIAQKGREDIGQLLGSNRQICDPFSIFPKILKDLSTKFKPQTQHQTFFLLNYPPQLLLLQSFNLLRGILASKSETYLLSLINLASKQYKQLLQRLLAYCYLWLSCLMSLEQQGKKYEQKFIELCKMEGINMQNINSGCFVNFKNAEMVEFLQINKSKKTILCGEHSELRGDTIFVETYQNILMLNLFQFLAHSKNSKIMVIGQRQSGKSALVQHYLSKIDKSGSFHAQSLSIYSYLDLVRLYKAFKSIATSNKQIQQFSLEQPHLDKNKMLSTSIFVAIEDISMNMYQSGISYLKHITNAYGFYVQQQKVRLKGSQVIVERSLHMNPTDDQLAFLPIRIRFDDQYFVEVFQSIYTAIGLSSIKHNDADYQLLKIKGIVVKNMLGLIKNISKGLKQSYLNWTYTFPLCTIKLILLQMARTTIQSKCDFLQKICYRLQHQLALKLKDDRAKDTFKNIFDGFKATLKKDLKEDISLQSGQTLIKQQQASQKLVAYIKEKRYLQCLGKSKTFLSNLVKLEYCLSNSKELIVFNECWIPGIGDFLRIGVEILNIRLVEITSFQHLQSICARGQPQMMNLSKKVLLLIPFWLMSYPKVLPLLSCRLFKHLRPSLHSSETLRANLITSANSLPKVLWALQYNQQQQQQAHNILPHKYMMLHGTWIYIDQLKETDILVQLQQYLKREKEELNQADNSVVLPRICKLYRLLEQQCFKKMPTSIQSYLTSANTFSRFIRTLLDVYFQRKYGLKLKLQQLNLTINKLEQYQLEYSLFKDKNRQLKQTYHDRKHRIAKLNQQLLDMQDVWQGYSLNAEYQEFQKRKLEIVNNQKMTQAIKNKEKTLLERLQTYKNFPRTVIRDVFKEIANLKSLFVINPSQSPVFSILALLIQGSDEASAIKKTIQDVNLNLRIREINFTNKSWQFMKIIEQKVMLLGQQNQEYKGFQCLLEWIKYSVAYYFFCFERDAKSKQIQQSRLKTYKNLIGVEMEDKIDDLELRMLELKQKIQTEETLLDQVENRLTQSNSLLQKLRDFELFQLLLSQSNKQKAKIHRQYKLCLQSSAYFSLKLNYLYPCETQGPYSPQGPYFQQFVPMISAIQRTFLRWCCEQGQTVDILFFQDQLHSLFKNKHQGNILYQQQAYQRFSQIRICKEIQKGWSALGSMTDPAHNKIILPRYVPGNIYQKFRYILYLLNSRQQHSKVLIKDKYKIMRKYLNIQTLQKLTLQRRRTKAQAKNENEQPIIAYKIPSGTSAFLWYSSPIFLIELPPKILQVSLFSMPIDKNKCLNILKLDSTEYILPQLYSIKIIFTCSTQLLSSSLLNQFYYIVLDEDSQDCKQIVNHYLCKYQQILASMLAFIGDRVGSEACKGRAQTYIRSRLRKRISQQVSDAEQKSRYSLINQDYLVNSSQSLVTVATIAFRQSIQRIKNWKITLQDLSLMNQIKNGVSQFEQQFIDPSSKEIISIYQVCNDLEEQLRSRKQYLFPPEQSHRDVEFVAKLVREGLRSTRLKNNNNITNSKLLESVVRFILNHYCDTHPLKDLNTLCLYLKTYCLKHSEASNLQVLNLLHAFNNQNALEMMVDQRTESYLQTVAMDLPNCRLQFQKILKTYRDLCIGKGQYSNFFKYKNLVYNPDNANQLIQAFEFTTAKQPQASYENLSLFGKLLMKKMLVPEIFYEDCWKKALQWKSTFSDKCTKQYYTGNFCFFFCCVDFWSVFLSSFISDSFEYIRIPDDPYGHDLNHPDKLITEANPHKPIIIIDQRQWLSDQKKMYRNRQRLKQYLALKRNRIFIFLGEQYHNLLNQLLLKEERKEANNNTCDCKLHFIDPIEMFDIFTNTEPVKNNQGLEELQGQRNYTSFMNDILAKYPIFNEKKAMEIVLTQTMESALLHTAELSSMDQISTLLIWHPFSNFYLGGGLLQPVLASRGQCPLNIDLAIQSIQTKVFSPDKVNTIMNYISRNKMSITSFLKHQLNSPKTTANSRFLSEPPSKQQRTQGGHLDQLICRFNLNPPANLPNHDKIIESKQHRNIRRISRSKSGRIQNNQLSHIFNQNLQIQQVILASLGQLIEEAQNIVDQMVYNWKVYQGDILFLSQYQIVKFQHSNGILPMICDQYDRLLQAFQEFQKLVNAKQAKKWELPLIPSYMNTIHSKIQGCGLISLGYHESFRHNDEVILRCYKGNSCHECSTLVKRQATERFLILLRDQLCQICLNGYFLPMKQQHSKIWFTINGTTFMVSIYCNRLIKAII